jgi:hypothetical protein
MYYAPRLSPEKPGMPVLGYFTVVGGILLGLLFAADAYMPRHEQLSFVSHVDGLPASYKGEPKYVVAAAPHIAPAPAIAETTGSGFALAGEEPKRQPALAAQPTLTAQPVVQEAVKPAPRKVTRKRQQPDGDDFFGQNRRQQDFGMFREPSFGSREPSWRDSWASGAFEQRERPRRSAQRSENGSRGGDNFWHFR